MKKRNNVLSFNQFIFEGWDTMEPTDQLRVGDVAIELFQRYVYDSDGNQTSIVAKLNPEFLTKMGVMSDEEMSDSNIDYNFGLYITLVGAEAEYDRDWQDAGFEDFPVLQEVPRVFDTMEQFKQWCQEQDNEMLNVFNQISADKDNSNPMESIEIYDNGENVIDRYTVIIGNDVFTMSHNPTSPNGVNQYVGSRNEIDINNIGKLITDIPPEVRDAAIARATAE